MTGLLGMMAAGAAKGYSQGRSNELQQEQAFNLKKALMDAEVDKQLRLQEAGYAMEDKRNAEVMERNKQYMADVENDDGTTRKATVNDAASRAMESGDFKTGGLLASMSPKGKDFQGFKLDDGSIVAFDKSSGTATVAFEGGGEMNIPKNEIELAVRAADGDFKKAMDIIVRQKSRVAAAGRAPKSPSAAAEKKRDFINAYRDNPEYVKDGQLTAAGYDKLNNIDNNQYEEVTMKPSTDFSGNPAKDKDGNPIMLESVKRKRKVSDNPKPSTSKGKLLTDDQGNYIFNR